MSAVTKVSTAEFLQDQSKDTAQLFSATIFTQGALMIARGLKSPAPGLADGVSWLGNLIDIFKVLNVFMHVKTIIDWSKKKITVHTAKNVAFEKRIQKLTIANSATGVAISALCVIRIVNFFGKFGGLTKFMGLVKLFPFGSFLCCFEILKATLAIAISASNLKQNQKTTKKEIQKIALWNGPIDAKFTQAKIARIQTKMLVLKTGPEYTKLAEKKRSWEKIEAKLKTDTLTPDDQKTLAKLKERKIEKHTIKLANLKIDKKRDQVNLFLQSLIITVWVSVIIFNALAVIAMPVPLIIIGTIGISIATTSVSLALHRKYVKAREIKRIPAPQV